MSKERGHLLNLWDQTARENLLSSLRIYLFKLFNWHNIKCVWQNISSAKFYMTEYLPLMTEHHLCLTELFKCMTELFHCMTEYLVCMTELRLGTGFVWQHLPKMSKIQIFVQKHPVLMKILKNPRDRIREFIFKKLCQEDFAIGLLFKVVIGQIFF